MKKYKDDFREELESELDYEDDEKETEKETYNKEDGHYQVGSDLKQEEVSYFMARYPKEAKEIFENCPPEEQKEKLMELERGKETTKGLTEALSGITIVINTGR